MSSLANGYLWLATTQTSVTWGRELTEAEQTAIDNQKKTFVAAGTLIGGDRVYTENNQVTVKWNNADDAAAYIATCQSFTPPPLEAVVYPL